MNGCLPEILNIRPKKQLKNISFELSRTRGENGSNAALCEQSRMSNVGAGELRSRGNGIKDRKKQTIEDDMDKEKKPTPMELVSINGPPSGNDQQIVECFHKSGNVKQQSPIKVRTSKDNSKLKELLREKDREISRLQEIIRKISLDRDSAFCTNVNSRMRVEELKNKLTCQSRDVEHFTTVERLRSKQKVSSETERLRQERNEARVQLAHHEKLVWQLRKQVDHLGYISQQRYKTIQELGKKMSVKDKSLQEMRKRMEQAQLIPVTGSSLTERRVSVSDISRNVLWETSRLRTVNE